MASVNTVTARQFSSKTLSESLKSEMPFLSLLASSTLCVSFGQWYRLLFFVKPVLRKWNISVTITLVLIYINILKVTWLF
jgi:hypothetical protein